MAVKTMLFHFRCEPEMVERLRVLAERNYRSTSGEVRLAVDHHLAENGLLNDGERATTPAPRKVTASRNGGA